MMNKTLTSELNAPAVLAPVDLRVKYPSYKSMDQFIDIGRLRSLDGYIRSKIERHIAAQNDPKFYTGPYTLVEEKSGHPGSRMIYLSESTVPDNYFNLDSSELWTPSPAAEEFALLMDFIATLPFKATGRMLIMYDEVPRPVPAHRDHTETEVLHDFIWFRTNLDKPFYILNPFTGKKNTVIGYSAWFDTVNQFHGSDEIDKLAFSIRVDGVFEDDFKTNIPVPEFNKASTPSYWASFDEQGEG